MHLPILTVLGVTHSTTTYSVLTRQLHTGRFGESVIRQFVMLLLPLIFVATVVEPSPWVQDRFVISMCTDPIGTELVVHPATMHIKREIAVMCTAIKPRPSSFILQGITLATHHQINASLTLHSTPPNPTPSYPGSV